MRYLILGAGPAGLAFANRLKQAGEADFLVIEKEQTAGGLCRSANVGGSPLDIGGGHFLDVRRPKVKEFLFSFMPEREWDLYDRDSQIAVNGRMIKYPIEANIWQMGLEDQVKYLRSIAVAGCDLGTEMPERFIDWIYWKLGDRIAEDYMIPYNQKMFGRELDQLGTYWLEKLPDVSFEETLLSCLTKMPCGRQPAHTQFYYPKRYGYGELWLRMADAIKDAVRYGETIECIDLCTRTAITTAGERYSADVIVTTIPWIEFKELVGMPEELKTSIGKLRYSSIQIGYHAQDMDTDAHWIYYPDPDLPYHRILVRHNFCPGSRGYWTEANTERVDGREEEYTYIDKYAYPLNTIDKPMIMDRLLAWCKEHRVYGLGRWGEHQHYNSDVTVAQAMRLADSLLQGGTYL